MCNWTWCVYAGIIATGILLGRTHKEVLCAASVADRHLPAEAVRLRRQPFGNERTAVRIEGREETRVEKLAAVASWELACHLLRVCWQNVPGTVNCGRCHKCVRTQLGLAACGALGAVPTLPATIDPDRVAAHPAVSRSDRAYLTEVREALSGKGQVDLIHALDRALSRGKWLPT